MELRLRGGSVVTAGTYIGDFLPALSTACKETVFAFEPSLENYEYAEENIRLNHLTNVKLAHLGISYTAHSMKLCTATKDIELQGGSFLTEDPHPAWTVEDTKVTTLDQELPANERISLIQLDVEGHEYEALLGAKETIARWNPIIVLEIFDKGNQPQIEEAIPTYRVGPMIDGDQVYYSSLE